jgi:hypothetical protein
MIEDLYCGNIPRVKRRKQLMCTTQILSERAGRPGSPARSLRIWDYMLGVALGIDNVVSDIPVALQTWTTELP